MEELAKSMEESAKKENCHDDEVDHIHGRNWRGPRGARAKRFYIRGTKPDTSVKKGVMAMHELLAARCLLLAAWRFALATNTILTNTCLYQMFSGHFIDCSLKE